MTKSIARVLIRVPERDSHSADGCDVVSRSPAPFAAWAISCLVRAVIHPSSAVRQGLFSGTSR